MKKLVLALLLTLNFISSNVFAIDPTLNWKTIESEHFSVHYDEKNKKFAERVISIAEPVHQKLSQQINWTPAEKTHIVLSDESDSPNGSVSPIFFNLSILFITPPTNVNTLEDFDDWLTTLITHEYTHVLHLDKNTGPPSVLRKIFGRHFLLFPNIFQPSWVLEGFATHKETDASQGVGRGQSSFFASMMRAEVAQGIKSISEVNLPIARWPAGTTQYLYGVYFMNFIAQTYSEKKLQQWVDAYSNNLIPFFINSNAVEVFGKNLTQLWQEFELWLQQKFQPQIEQITAQGLSEVKKISKNDYAISSLVATRKNNQDEVFYVQNTGYQRSHLMLQDETGETKKLLELNSAADISLHKKSGILLTQYEICENYAVYKDIYLYQSSDDSLKRLSHCGRYLSASWHPDGKKAVVVHNQAGMFELQWFNIKTQQTQTIWQAEHNEIIGQIDVAPDGLSLVASIWRKNNGWNIEQFNFASKQWTAITKGGDVAAYPRFSGNENIIFSLEKNQVYNLYQYHLKTQQLQQLTNLVSGAYMSSKAENSNHVYYIGYSAKGVGVYSLNLKTQKSFHRHNSIKKDDVTAAQHEQGLMQKSTMPNEVSDKTVNKTVTKIKNNLFLNSKPIKTPTYPQSEHVQKDYSAWQSLRPRWWFPFFSITEQRQELGVMTQGNDALGRHNYALNLNFDIKLNKASGKISYRYADRFLLSWEKTNDITIDDNDKIDKVFGQETATASYLFHYRKIKYQSTFLLSALSDKITVEKFSSAKKLAKDKKNNSLLATWFYNSSDVNALSISAIDGLRLKLSAEDSDVFDSVYSGKTYTLDWRQYIRLGKQNTLALRFVQGWGTQQPKPFRLGGEGGGVNVISSLLDDVSQSSLAQRSYALRGYSEGKKQLTGRRMQLLSGEWRFAMHRYEKGLMAPPVGLMQWFGSVFAEVGTVYDNSAEKYYSSAGIEFLTDVNLFYALNMRLRLGIAHGFDDELGDDRIYLKLGSSF